MDDGQLRQDGKQDVPELVAVVYHELRILHYLVYALVHILFMLALDKLLSLLSGCLFSKLLVYRE